MALSKTQISELYVAIFNRASEGSGNTYWQTFSSDDSAAEVASAMLASTAAEDYFGSSLDENQAFIETIYENTLSKTLADDPDGIAYWVGRLDSGESRGQIVSELVAAVANFADATDPATIRAYNQFNNRVEVSNYTADNLQDVPDDFATSLAFGEGGLVVSEDAATVTSAQSSVDAIVNPEAPATGLTAALNDLSGARGDVTAKEAEIASFLEDAYDNEFVAAVTVDGADTDTTVAADDVVEANIAAAHEDAADVLVGSADVNSSITEGGAAFNALTDAAQDSRISTALTDLDADIATAQTAVNTAADDLETGVAGLVATAQASADSLEDALDAQDVQDAATTEALTAASAVATQSVGGSPAAVTIQGTTSGPTGEGEATDATDTVTITEITNGTVSFTSAVALNTAGTTYTITLGTGVTTTISKSFLDAVLVAAQASVNAEAAVTSAEAALAADVIDVLEAQDSTFEGGSADYTSLDADGALSLTGNTPDIDYSLASEGATADVAVGGADVNTYAAALATLATAQSEKSDFEDAVADWQSTEALVDGLATLNSDLSDLNDAVTAAQAAIENDTDADPAGLGITLLEDADNFTIEDDVYLYAEGSGTQTLTGFGANGEDQIFFGEGFSLVQIPDGDTISDNVGDSAALGILWQQTGTNGADLTLYVEAETFGGNSAGTSDVVEITLTGFDATDITSFEGGFLSAGVA
jgi:hypothetical protein